jgi:hypothetical protein
MEVAATQTLDKLSTSMKTFHGQQKAEIEELFQVAQMNLQQDLDEFQFHLQETLHAVIFGADHPNPRAQHAEPSSRAIAVEAEEEALSNEETQQNQRSQPATEPTTSTRSSGRDVTTTPSLEKRGHGILLIFSGQKCGG